MALMLACTEGASGGDVGEADTGGSWPSAWEYDGDPTGETTFDGETVAAVITEAVERAFEYSAAPLHQDYLAAVAARDDRCVTWSEATTNGLTYTHWIGEGRLCTVDTSGIFYGQAHHYGGDSFHADELPVGMGLAPSAGGSASTLVLAGDTVTGQTLITLPDDTHFWSSGNWATFSGLDEASAIRLWASSVSGSFVFTGDSQAAWLASSANADWSVRVELDTASTEARVVTLSGGLMNLPDTGGTISTTAIVLMTDDWASSHGSSPGDSACSTEPSGTVAVRGPAGRWADVSFGADESGGSCDGCGSWDGVAVCVDWSPLLEWVDSPW